jgi:hypothetical protein
MKNILLIQSSPRGPESYSQRVAESIVNEIMDRNPGQQSPFVIWPKTRCHMSGQRLSVRFRLSREN